MANDVKIRFRSFLPGVGFDVNGNAKQGKTQVIGSISVTSYAPGAEVLAPRDFGLVTVDKIDFRVADDTGSDSGSRHRAVRWDKTSSGFYLVLIGDAGNANEYALAATETVEFQAIGDSAHDVELV